jgi:hypothetical protein
MDQQRVNVYYLGKLKEGIDINTATAQLVVTFKTSSEKALKILQANHKITLIREVKPAKAFEYKSILENIGLIIRLEKTIDTKPIYDVCAQRTKLHDAPQQDTDSNSLTRYLLESVQQEKEQKKKVI